MKGFPCIIKCQTSYHRSYSIQNKSRMLTALLDAARRRIRWKRYGITTEHLQIFAKIEETTTTAPGSTSPSLLKQINTPRSNQEQRTHLLTHKCSPSRALITQIVELDQVRQQRFWRRWRKDITMQNMIRFERPMFPFIVLTQPRSSSLRSSQTNTRVFMGKIQRLQHQMKANLLVLCLASSIFQRCTQSFKRVASWWNITVDGLLRKTRNLLKATWNWRLHRGAWVPRLHAKQSSQQLEGLPAFVKLAIPRTRLHSSCKGSVPTPRLSGTHLSFREEQKI